MDRDARARQAIEAGRSLLLATRGGALQLGHSDTQAAFNVAEAETAELLGVPLDRADANFASLSCWKQLSVYSVLEEMLDWQEKVDCLRSKLTPMQWQHWRSLPVLPRTALLLLGWPAWLLKRAGAQPISDGAWFRLCVGSVLFYIMLGLAVTMPPLGVALWLILTAVWLLLVVNLAMICDKQQLEQDAAELRSCGKSARQLRDDHAALPGLCSLALAMAFRLGTCEMEARDARNRAGSILHGRR
ncbi:hypothetical protein ABPG77_010230 [Micractinium sp. CCAP 211/92]